MLKAIIWLSVIASIEATVQATSCQGCQGSDCDVQGNKDVVFLVDWTKTSTSANDLKDFLKDVVGKLDIDFSSSQTHENTEAGIVYFGPNPTVAVTLDNTLTSHGEICDVIDGFPQRKGQTFTHEALEEAAEMFTNGRPTACKVAVVVTDGGSDNKPETVAQAQNLRNLGTRMCVVHIGTNGTSQETSNRVAEIQALAGSNPDRGEIIRNEADPDNLDSLVADTIRCIKRCPGACGEIDLENYCSRDRLCVPFGTCCDDYEKRCLDKSAHTCDATHHGKSTYQDAPQWPTCFCEAQSCGCFNDCCDGLDEIPECDGDDYMYYYFYNYYSFYYSEK